jgi:hypothetical protein
VNRRLRRAAAALFVVCAVLLVIGVGAEADSHNEAAATAPHGESNEGAGHDETAEAAQPDATTVGHDEASETVLGLDAESPAAVVAAVVLSVALAVGLWLLNNRRLSVVAAAVAVAFAVLDIAEISSQVDRSHTAVAVLAVVIGAGHLAAAATATLSARSAAAGAPSDWS